MITLERLGGLLNRDLVRVVYGKIVDANGEPYLTFMLSWIVLNHVYVTYCDQEPLPPGQQGDRKQLLHFALHAEVTAARDAVLNSAGGSARVQLPVTKRLRSGGREALVPRLGSKRVTASDFSCEEHFEVIYAIRNNVMHGDKAGISAVDMANISFAAIHTRSLLEQIAFAARVSLH